MTSDSSIKENVLRELKWEPSISETEIGVIVKDGAVTLTGWVQSFLEKVTANRAVRRVAGVRAIANEIEVRLPDKSRLADDEIARRIAHVLDWNTGIPSDDVKAEIQNGQVTLRGTVDWRYQRTNTERLVHGVAGVKSVINHILVKKRATSHDLKQEIETALRRHADIEASKISVVVSDGVVTLEGEVDSFSDMDLVEDAVWAAPGISKVIDNLRVV